MNPTIDSILCSIIASVICDIGKYGLGQFKYRKANFEKKDVEKYVLERIDKKYEILCDSGILLNFIRSPLIIDTINNYTTYIITGKLKNNFSSEILDRNGKHKNLEEQDIITFLADNLHKRYVDADVLVKPEKQILMSFFRDTFILCSDYILEQLSQEETAMIFFVNNKMNIFGNGITSKLDEIVSILKQSIQTDVIHENKKFLNDKEYYTAILKDNHKMAHIYLLDKFNINEFYVPPFLMQREERIHGLNFRYGYVRNNSLYRMQLKDNINNDVDFDDWKYIFERSNIVYVTGGAGYGKSLFMKKMIVEHEKLNIVDSNEYIVIYGELKNFFMNSTDSAMPVIDFLQSSMKRETLIEDSRVSTELINYYLQRGRCIILLDALDEVDKEKRQELHSHVIHYFRNQNLNNKVCITSRARGFLPEKDIEVLEIEPLDGVQIETYVDNIIKLGKFDKSDRESFLQQTQVLVQKGFLNSFLVLSLLINIYKAERELPENKLELYQKCFEYISNKREKEKSQKKYDWNLISTLMKDNTFMELANLCLPNNSDVSKDIIKEKLTQIYKTKYVSENQTELAIDQFLIFCSDRTELFVPASGEDCFKFFHRSFFEYFYSQYIFTRMSIVEDIYNAWKTFDVDSEIFELTLAMFKQKNENKYQDIVEFLFKKLNKSFKNIGERINVMNMLVLCMQVIDDEVYKKQFIDFLVNNVEFCKKHIKSIHNQRFIINVICSNNKYRDMIIDKYQYIAIFECVGEFLKIYPEAEQFLKQNKKRQDLNEHMEANKFKFQHFYNYNFYSQIYFSNIRLNTVFERLESADIAEIGKNAGANIRDINKMQFKYKKYMSLDPELKANVDKLLL
ncbi:hypothetical protein D3Z36_04665 [Lachnospiraceae bacterium]|nr:hypothetical protein [Lachnospiraceae bacterium]